MLSNAKTKLFRRFLHQSVRKVPFTTKRWSVRLVYRPSSFSSNPVRQLPSLFASKLSYGCWHKSQLLFFYPSYSMMLVLLSRESRIEALLIASIESSAWLIKRTATACIAGSTPSFSQIESWFAPLRVDVGEEIENGEKSLPAVSLPKFR